MKSLLLDTHAWVWSFGADHLLSERARAAITTADVVYLSPMSFFEIGQKVRTGRWPETEAHVHGLPPIFKLPVAVALTDDAAEQLCQRHGIADQDERVKHVAAAIERYKRRVRYHYAMLKGEAKYDLDMQRAGEITARERDDWQRRFDHLKRQQKIGNRKAQMTAVQRQFSRV